MSDIYKPKDFRGLLGTSGMSEALLTNHFTLYEGYVKNTNALLDLLQTKEVGTPEYAELKRRFGWEWNGMRLHEYYFGNLSPSPKGRDGGDLLAASLKKDFGSFEAWEKDFRGVGAMRGIGWTILSYDPVAGRLFNGWVNEHDGGHLSGSIPLLVLDVFEHAFMLDYGLKRAEYIETFFRAIDWEVVSKRFDEVSKNENKSS
ncbi:MAG: superoxide dismutase [Candidatus Moraniibacteriota bacterium]|nr:MAG: superoxide dismutase [Candidatus Moranbacteria bacterium]